MNIFQQVVILSAELSTNRAEKNRQLTSNLEASLNDCQISFNKANGYYKDAHEKSFVCLPKNADEIESLKDFAFKNFNQESILLQDANGLCTLEFNDNTTKTIGKFRNISPKQIEQYDSYTDFSGKVFVAEAI